MKDLNEVKPNRKERRATAAYQKRRARLFSQISGELTETEKQYSDNVDFSIFNMVLERIPFQGYKDTMDVLRTFYRSLYPFMRSMLAQNIYLKDIVQDERFREDIERQLSGEERDEFRRVVDSPDNPFEECKKILDKIKAEAKKGAKTSTIIKPKHTIITR